MDYSSNLKKLKKTLKLTTEQMSNDIDMPARTLGSYERGESKIPLELLTKLINKYSVNPLWFSTGEGEMFLTPSIKSTDSVRIIKFKKNHIYKFELED